MSDQKRQPGDASYLGFLFEDAQGEEIVVHLRSGGSHRGQLGTLEYENVRDYERQMQFPGQGVVPFVPTKPRIAAVNLVHGDCVTWIRRDEIAAVTQRRRRS